METAAAFDPVLGHAKPKLLLTQAVAQGKIAPAYLFAGPNGVGRRLAADCFAQLIFGQAARYGSDPQAQQSLAQRLSLGNHPDLLRVEPTFLHQGKTLTRAEAEAAGLKRKTAPQIRLSQVRDVARFVSRPPLEASRSLVVIDQAETMAEAAANGLLKTLEEPGNATLILLAPSPEVLLSTLVSRCQRIAFGALGQAEVEAVLAVQGWTELLDHAEILALAEGSPGRAIALWQQLQSMPEEIMTAIAQLANWLSPAPSQASAATPKAVLTLAALIAKQLDLEGQLWLINYLQQRLWQTTRVRSRPALEALEEGRQLLLRYVQPQLVWEVLLLKVSGLDRPGAQRPWIPGHPF